ncbi:hypothetical protein PsalMR5_04241 (plasmid) [Piscirickettsia salmonis]|nr:hypothetical protein [Piscirickettsia salmonis]QGP56751.1 hypothetical protein PsalSR1_04240 [Piscirickettsia salmonis]QGP66316.1 hypothetical protein PsalMR5_04241 [Piscirickettsia salmonis]
MPSPYSYDLRIRALLWFNETGHLGGRLNIMIHRGVYEAEETKQKLP